MGYGDVSLESIYSGGGSSFDPDYGNFTGYRMSAAQMGFPGSPQTANQLGETVNAMKQGAKAFEITMLSPETMETIPKQHFEEMRALMKLSGVKPSIHGPLIDAAGFGEKGIWEGEEARINNERRMFEALERAQVVGPEGNIPVVFHVSNGVPGEEWKPGNEKAGEDRFVLNKGGMVNRETGEVRATQRDYQFRPSHPELLDKGMKEGGPKGILFSAEDSVRSANDTGWDKKLLEVAEMTQHTDDILGRAPMDLKKYGNVGVDVANKKLIVPTENGKYSELPIFEEGTTERQAYDTMRKADMFLDNAQLSFGSAFHQAWQYGTDEQREKLRTLSENYSEKLREVSGRISSPVEKKQLIDDSVQELKSITAGHAPEVYQNVTDFAIEKAATTFGNLASKSYDNLKGDKCPMIAIEPVLFGQFGLSKPDQLIKVVEGARENFAEHLIEKGMNEKNAKSLADEKIGVTWDVGHINIMKKYGFNDKDVIEATKQVAPMVKHVHLTDNFGHADTHLAPGMGNAPIKEVLEELEKTGRLGEMRKIVESGAFVQHFKKSPFPLSLAAFGSPIYGMKAGMGWNQAMNVQGSYFGGYGTSNPSIHHQYFGAGFTTMPVELGGQMPGGSSRFGGTPMA